MGFSIFIAQVLGIIFLIVGISILINRANMRAVITDFIDHPAFLVIVGFLNVVMGALIVASHNIWQPNWAVLITIVGWLLLIRGFVLLAFPSFVRARLTRVSAKETPIYVGATVFLILGLIFCYFGFV